MVIVGYEGNNFLVLNSWSNQWRLDGYVWLTERYITWGVTGDLTVIDGWEKIRGAR